MCLQRCIDLIFGFLSSLWHRTDYSSVIGLATEHQHYTTSREWKFWFVLTDKYNMALCVKHNDISVCLLLEEVRLCGHYSGSCVRRGERKTQLVLQKIIYIQYRWSRSDSASFLSHVIDTQHNRCQIWRDGRSLAWLDRIQAATSGAVRRQRGEQQLK